MVGNEIESRALTFSEGERNDNSLGSYNNSQHNEILTLKVVLYVERMYGPKAVLYVLPQKKKRK